MPAQERKVVADIIQFPPKQSEIPIRDMLDAVPDDLTGAMVLGRRDGHIYFASSITDADKMIMLLRIAEQIVVDLAMSG